MFVFSSVLITLSDSARQPSINLSPLVISPRAGDSDPNRFERSLGEEDVDGDEDDIDDGIDWEPQPQESHFAVLHSSLPGVPQVHTSGKRLSPSGREKRKPRWHFGIRSRSPPMEVMLEIYRTLSVLDMEWKEKKYLGGLGGKQTNTEKFNRHDLDSGSSSTTVDAKAASSVYYVETRARVDDTVVSVFTTGAC
jgi:carbon catabolite-derepressing protein kinase